MAITVAGLVGLIGGILAGAWDGFAVMLWHGPHPLPVSDIFHLSLYSVALYGAIGFVLMVVIGAVGTGLIRVGRYRVERPQLSGIVVAIFVALAVYVFLPEGDNWVQILEFTVISIFSGLGLGGLTVYILRRGIRNETLAAACISLVVWASVLLYGALWINSTVMSGERFWKPTSLLSTLGLLLVVSLLAIVLFRISRFILQKYNPRRTRQAGWTLLAVVAAASIAISSVGPFNLDSTAQSKAVAASPASENETGPSPPEWMPNILLIVMDTVRADHLSCYGYDRYGDDIKTTPNIDKIASEGILFENAFSEAPWTLPSHASMFTSMFPTDHGTTAEHQWLEDDFETMAEVLGNDLGYRTYGYSNNIFVAPEKNLDQGFETFIVTNRGYALEETETETELAELLRLRRYIDRLFQENDGATHEVVVDDGAERTNEVVKGWIADALDGEDPFFIFINYMEAHAPYDNAPKPYSDLYLSGNATPLIPQIAKGDSAGYVVHIAPEQPMQRGEIETLNALYDQEITYLDYRIGELYDYLEELDILDDTLLIICSDHGENLADHNLLGHQLCVYDTLLHVALIIRYPDPKLEKRGFGPGTRFDEQVQLTDLFPTITDIIGYHPDYSAWYSGRGIRGHTLVRNPESTPAVAEYSIFTTVLENLRRNEAKFDTSKYARRLKTVRDGDFKYIWASDGRHELYNTREDPGEENNIIESELGKEKASELRTLLSEQLPGFEP